MSKAKHTIDFAQGGDTGYREDPEAIEPIADGERVGAAVANRKSENLRDRSEILRTETEYQKYLEDSDMAWIISAGNSVGLVPGAPSPQPQVVNWVPGTGIFEISDEVVIQPLNTPSGDTKETVQFEIDDGVQPGSAQIDIECYKFAYEDANDLRIVWEQRDPALMTLPVEFEFKGTPVTELHIIVRDPAFAAGVTLAADFAAAFVAANPTLEPKGFHGNPVIGGNTLHEVNLTTIQSATSTSSPLPVKPTYPDPLDLFFSRNYDREMHYLAPAQLAIFFATYSLADGDTLCIYYPELIDDTGSPPGGRMQQTPTTGPTPPNTVVTAGSLFVSSQEPDKLPIAIPLCKRVGNDLYFIDGTVVVYNQIGGVNFGENGYTVNRLNSTVLPIPANPALGYKPPQFSLDRWSIPADNLNNVLIDLQTFVNNKASLNFDEEVDGNWDVLGNWGFFNDVDIFNALFNIVGNASWIQGDTPSSGSNDRLMLMFQSGVGLASANDLIRSRIYYGRSGDIMITTNCYWDDSLDTAGKWRPDDTDLDAFMLRLTYSKLALFYKDQTEMAGSPPQWEFTGVFGGTDNWTKYNSWFMAGSDDAGGTIEQDIGFGQAVRILSTGYLTSEDEYAFNKKTLLYKSQPEPTSGAVVRLYSTGWELLVTQNAYWDSAQWNRDTNTAAAWEFSLRNGHFFTMDSPPPATWTINDWTSRLYHTSFHTFSGSVLGLMAYGHIYGYAYDRVRASLAMTNSGAGPQTVGDWISVTWHKKLENIAGGDVTINVSANASWTATPNIVNIDEYGCSIWGTSNSIPAGSLAYQELEIFAEVIP